MKRCKSRISWLTHLTEFSFFSFFPLYIAVKNKLIHGTNIIIWSRKNYFLISYWMWDALWISRADFSDIRRNMSKHVNLDLREKRAETCQDRSLESMSDWSLAGEHFAPGAKQKPFTESWQCVQSKPCRERHFTWACYVHWIHFQKRMSTRNESQLKILKENKPKPVEGVGL